MIERLSMSRTPLRLFVILDLLFVCVLLVAAVMAIWVLPSHDETASLSDGQEQPGVHRLIERVPQGLLRFLARQLDLNEEMNIATLVSALQFLLSVVLAWEIGQVAGEKSRSMRWSWRLVAVGLFFLALEELFEIHEFLGGLFPEGGSFTLGPFVLAGRSRWVVIYILPMICAAGFLLRVFCMTFAGMKKRLWQTFVGLACWMGAVGFESLMHSVPRNLIRTEILFEETLELAGVLLLIIAFSGYLRERRESRATAEEIPAAGAG